MKKIFILFFLLILISCKDDNNTPMTPPDDAFDPIATNATLLKEGMIVGVGHTINGTIKVYDNAGKKVVLFDPFTSQNGPDLKVYLSKDQNATQYINLGALKSTTGKQSYDVTGMPDLNEYKFVLVWCQQFSVLFGKAELQ